MASPAVSLFCDEMRSTELGLQDLEEAPRSLQGQSQLVDDHRSASTTDRNFVLVWSNCYQQYHDSL